MDDYKISLGAILDANAKGDLQKSIDNIKDLQIKISKAELTSSAIADIKNQLEKNGIDLKIVFGNTNQIANQAKQTGQQIGQQINQGLSQTMKSNDAVIERFKKSLSNMGVDSLSIDAVIKRLREYNIQIDSLNEKINTHNGKKGEIEFLTVDVGGIDEMGNAIQMIEKYNLTTDKFVDKTTQIGTAQKKAASSTKNWVAQQKTDITNLQNQINQINRAAKDTKAARPIGQENLGELEREYGKINDAIKQMGNLSGEAFTDQKNHVKTLISNFKSLVSEYRNADNVSMNFKGSNFKSGKIVSEQNYEKLKQEAREYSTQMEESFNKLDSLFSNISDSASLNATIDKMREVRAELARLKSEAMANSRAEKVGINVSGFQSKIDDLKRISPEISEFKTQINGAEVTIESLATELGEVKTQGDISVLNTKWRAFTDAAKAAGIAVKEATDSSNARIQLKIDTGEYDSKVDDLKAKLSQFGSTNKEAADAIRQLEEANKAFASDNTDDKQIEAAKQLDIAIKTATNSYRKLNAEYAKTSEIDSLAQKYQVFYDKNTAAHGKWGATLKAGIAELSSGSPVTLQRLQQLEAELLNIGNAARQSGKLGLSFFDKLKQGMSAFSQWTSATAIVSKGIQLGKEGIQFVRELDDALTDVVYTSDITKSQLENLGNSSVKMAKDLKASTANVLEAVKIYSTANATADDILRKSKPAIMLSNVSGMSGSESAKTIQTSLNQFELEDTEEGLLDIVDTLEYVSSQLNYDFTEGMKEITEGIEAAGSVAKNAGLDMQEYATMVGVAVEKTGQKNCPCM